MNNNNADLENKVSDNDKDIEEKIFTIRKEYNEKINSLNEELFKHKNYNEIINTKLTEDTQFISDDY